MKTGMMLACGMAVGLAAGCSGGPGVRWGNTDTSAEHRAEAACRAEAGGGQGGRAGAGAAYQACMAEFRRPERED